MSGFAAIGARPEPVIKLISYLALRPDQREASPPVGLRFDHASSAHAPPLRRRRAPRANTSIAGQAARRMRRRHHRVLAWTVDRPARWKFAIEKPR